MVLSGRPWACREENRTSKSRGDPPGPGCPGEEWWAGSASSSDPTSWLLRSWKRSVHFSETLQVTGGHYPNRAAGETAVGCPLRNAFLLKPPGALVTHNGSATCSLCPPSAYLKQCMGDAHAKNYLLLI